MKLDLQRLANIAGVTHTSKSKILKESSQSSESNLLATMAGVVLAEKKITPPTTFELWSFVNDFVKAVGDETAERLGINIHLVASMGEEDTKADQGRQHLIDAVDAIVDYGNDNDVNWTPPWVPVRSREDDEAEAADHYWNEYKDRKAMK